MLPPNQQDLPLITVGIIVLNREWIIKRMLQALQSQTYPHDRLFVVVVDGKSKDQTAEIARELLSESDFNGYQVIVKDTNIPEARNLCIQNMKGDYLLFWDSDVIMEPTAVTRTLEILKKENVDIVYSFVKEVTVSSAEEVNTKWQEWKNNLHQDKSKMPQAGVLGNTLISKKVLSYVAFDPDYTFYEDRDFSAKANKLGFKILETRNIIGFDVNTNRPQSDIYAFDMPLKKALRGIRKKALVQAQEISGDYSSVGKFLLTNKRYIFYVGYMPAIFLTVIGVFILNLWVSLIFPAYFLFYAVIQFRKRGFMQGFNAAARSIIVGVPTTYALLYYCLKLYLKNKL
ncbi:MAG: glycosyltransferase family 2 protein [Candidatus Bathyarchaeota archaeon]|nr:glycosyltransferase family 2 protein [Candidatus Bathyarchaeota archaeon]